MVTTYASFSSVENASAVRLCARGHVLPLSPRSSSIEKASPSTSIDQNLVLVRGSRLEIYEVNDVEGVACPLQLIFVVQLFGRPDSLRTARFPGAKFDSILLGFPEARLSRVDFNPETFQFDTSALHAFDEHQYKRIESSECTPTQMVIDPQNRCLVMSLHSGYLLVWPMITAPGESTEISTSNSKNIVHTALQSPSKTFVVDLSSNGVRRIKSLTFLDGFLEPTLMILYSSQDTWPGRHSILPRACALTAVSLNLSQEKHYQICSEISLPNDLHSLIALPMPLGGALVIGANLIIHFRDKIEYIFSVNEFGDREGGFRVDSVMSATRGMNLDAAKAVLLSANRVLIGLANGELYVLEIESIGDSVQRMALLFLARSHVAAEFCLMEPNCFFLASTLRDSLLIEFREQKNSTKSDSAFVTTDVLSSKTQSPYVLRVVDSLFSATPIVDISVGRSSRASRSQQDKHAEIVACCGKGRGGALCVISDGIRPKIIIASDLGGHVNGIWTVKDVTGYHSFVIVSMSKRTVVKRSSARSLKAVTDAGFMLTSPTLNAADVNDGTQICQVCENSVILMDAAGKLVASHTYNVMEGVIPTSAAIAFPYVAIPFSDGSLLILKITNKHQTCATLDIVLSPLTDITNRGGVLTATLYHDRSHDHLFRPLTVSDDKINITNPTDDDLEAMLFGSGGVDATTVKSECDDSVVISEVNEPTFVAVVCRKNGAFEIYSLPDFKLLFHCAFGDGARLLQHHNESENDVERENKMNVSSGSSNNRNVAQLHLHVLFDSPKAAPWITAVLVNGDLIVYRGFRFEENQGGLPLRFTRFDHGVITRPLLASTDDAAIQRPIRPFAALSGRCGIFIGGYRPLWVFGERGFYHIISHSNDSGSLISGFAAFHSEACKNGFLLISDNVLQICILPGESTTSFGGQRPTQRLPIKATPHYIAYHEVSETYSVVVSRRRAVFSVEDVTERSFPVADLRFELRLYLPGLQLIDTFDALDSPEEAMLCLRATPMNFQDSMRSFIAIGTSTVESEETQCRGSILLFEVHDTTPSDVSGKGLRYKKVFSSPEKGPVTALASIQGVICAAVGPRVLIYRWEKDHIVGIAFFDVDFYVSSISCLKNFIVLGDVFRGPVLLYWEASIRQLINLGKDLESEEVYAVDFLVDAESIAIVIADAKANIRMLAYAPERPESFGGQRLLARADFRDNTRITSFVSMRARDVAGMRSFTARRLLLSASIDGSLGCLAPVNELLYRRLFSLQTQMVYQIPHFAGLNPRQYRAYHTSLSSSVAAGTSHRNIIDIDFIKQFVCLDSHTQHKLAINIGSNAEQIIDDLLQMHLSCSFQSGAR